MGELALVFSYVPFLFLFRRTLWIHNEMHDCLMWLIFNFTRFCLDVFQEASYSLLFVNIIHQPYINNYTSTPIHRLVTEVSCLDVSMFTFSNNTMSHTWLQTCDTTILCLDDDVTTLRLCMELLGYYLCFPNISWSLLTERRLRL